MKIENMVLPVKGAVRCGMESSNGGSKDQHLRDKGLGRSEEKVLLFSEKTKRSQGYYPVVCQDHTGDTL